MPQKHEALMFLMQLPLFEDWQYDDLSHLIKAMELKTVKEGTNLYKIGEEPK